MQEEEKIINVYILKNRFKMKKVLFGIAGFAAILVVVLFNYSIVTPYCTIHAGLLTFGAIIGAMCSVYFIEVNGRKEDKKEIIRLKKDLEVESTERKRLLGLCRRHTDNPLYRNDYYELKNKYEIIEKERDELKKIVVDKDATIEIMDKYSNSRMHCFIDNHQFLTFCSAYFNGGNVMSQNALADKLGVSRAKVRRTANKINEIIGYDYIKWGNAKTVKHEDSHNYVKCGICGKDINIKTAVSDAECSWCCKEHYDGKTFKKTSPVLVGIDCVATVLDENDDSNLLKDMTAKKPYKLKFDEFEGLRIPENFMLNFDQVKIKAKKGEHSCGCNLKMDCRRILCCECICHESNNAVVLRLIAKVEKEMGK